MSHAKIEQRPDGWTAKLHRGSLTLGESATCLVCAVGGLPILYVGAQLFGELIPWTSSVGLGTAMVRMLVGGSVVGFVFSVALGLLGFPALELYRTLISHDLVVNPTSITIRRLRGETLVRTVRYRMSDELHLELVPGGMVIGGVEIREQDAQLILEVQERVAHMKGQSDTGSLHDVPEEMRRFLAPESV